MARGPNDRLDSWKEIAEYLGRDVRTVIRWEQEKKLPVHRVPGGKRQAVFSFASEIDAWLKSEGAEGEPASRGQPNRTRDSSERGEGPEIVGTRPVLLPDLATSEADPYTRGSPVPERPILAFPRPTEEPPAASAALPRPTAFEYALGLLRTPRSRLRWSNAVAAVGVLATCVAVGMWMRWPLPVPQVASYAEISQGVTTDRAVGGLATDGLRLYFNREHGGLVEVSTGGGETASLPLSLRGAAVEDISPDRAELLLSTTLGTGDECPLWVLPLPAGSPHRVGNVLAHGAGWSPDGHRIVFANGNGLYLTDTEGESPRPLATLSGRPWNPRWSPDGRGLRFTVDGNGQGGGLWEVSPDGARLHPLLAGWNKCSFDHSLGNWTPDGAYYVFDCRFQGRGELWALREKSPFWRPREAQPFRLSQGPMTWWDPVPSSDGKRVFAIGQVARAELVRYDSVSAQLIPYLSGMPADMLDFSRDGMWLTYVAYPERTLWRSKLDGSEKLQLTLPPGEAAYPRWSPDRRWIAYSFNQGKGTKINLMPADGGAPVTPVPGSGNQSHPSWSPDGETLAFAGAPWLENFAPSSSAVRLLHLKDDRLETLPGSDGFWSPRWSPDGRYIAAVSADSRRVVVFDFKTRAWTELASGLYAEYTCWSHDGRHLYISTASNDGDPALYAVEPGRPKLQRILSLKSIRLASTVGVWFGLTPDDSPLFLRDRAEGAVYALNLRWP